MASSNSSPKNQVEMFTRRASFLSLHLQNVVFPAVPKTLLISTTWILGWLKYDFKNRKVRPTHYSIRSKPDRPGSAHPMNWVIEWSNSDNDEDWTVIDRRNGITDLNNRSVVCNFEIQRQGNEKDFYRYLRLRQTGKNAQGDYYLVSKRDMSIQKFAIYMGQIFK